jgi:hypothetical protein
MNKRNGPRLILLGALVLIVIHMASLMYDWRNGQPVTVEVLGIASMALTALAMAMHLRSDTHDK